ncbi:unnamed protein product [Merluccius merluccius]
METIAEMIPFAKEMLSHRPGRGLVKVYLLGSTLALLGAVGGLVETVFLPFLEERQQQGVKEEGEPELLFMEMRSDNNKKQLLKPQTVSSMADDKLLVTAAQRTTVHRLHASS